MELYTLDTGFVQNQIIDSYGSLIWTERYNAAGDVTITAPPESVALPYLVEGAFLSIEGSREVMIIETVSYSDEDGFWTIVGRTLNAFLESRILRNTWSTAKDGWSLTGTPGAIAGQIMSDMCGASGLMHSGAVIPGGTLEALPNLLIGSLASGVSQTIVVPYGNVFDGIKAVCDQGSLGHSLYPQLKVGGYDLIFTAYAGLDRTTSQTTNPWVIFEPALDSFTNIKKVRSIAGYKNAAYAWANGLTAQSQIGIAYAPGASGLSGFQRRTLMVEASDVNAADYTATQLTSILNQKAKDALANNNYVKLTDGELVPQSGFAYGTDYKLGDIIELRDSSNIAEQARVTEYIRSQDASGETAYPTLSVIS